MSLFYFVMFRFEYFESATVTAVAPPHGTDGGGTALEVFGIGALGAGSDETSVGCALGTISPIAAR